MLDSLTPDEIDAMLYRAHREAARCWGEFRACDDPDLRPILRDCARSADAYWEEIRFVAQRIHARQETSPDDLCTMGSPDVFEGDDADHCPLCWHDFLTGVTTDHAHEKPYVTEADLARQNDFDMDGGNFDSRGNRI
jgi:hypothetical protein